MFRLKTPTLVDYSDVLSPSVVEVAHVLQDDVGLTLLKRPPPSHLNRMQVSKSRDVFPTTGHVSDVQKPDSTSENVFRIKCEIEEDSDVEIIEVKDTKEDRVIEIMDIANDEVTSILPPPPTTTSTTTGTTSTTRLKSPKQEENLSRHELNCIQKIMALEERMNTILKMCDANKNTKNIKEEIIDDEKPSSSQIQPPVQFLSSSSGHSKYNPDERKGNIWYACIFCQKKFYSDLPSLQAHIKKMHYFRAMQLLHFAGKDVKDKLLEFWRQKNQRIAPPFHQSSSSRRSRFISHGESEVLMLNQPKGEPNAEERISVLPRPNDEAAIQRNKERFLSAIREHKNRRRNRFEPYRTTSLSATCTSPMSLPSGSPAPRSDSTQRCRSQPTAELFAHDEVRSLIPPPAAYSAAAQSTIISPPEFYSESETWSTLIPPPPLEDFQTTPPPPVSPPPLCAIPPPPPSTSPFLPEFLLSVKPPPPMPPLLHIKPNLVVKEEPLDDPKQLHIPIRPLPFQSTEQSKLLFKPKPKQSFSSSHKDKNVVSDSQHRISDAMTSSKSTEESMTSFEVPELVVCSVCSEVFTDMQKYQVHIREEHEKGQKGQVDAVKDKGHTEVANENQSDKELRLKRLLFIAESNSTTNKKMKMSSTENEETERKNIPTESESQHHLVVATQELSLQRQHSDEKKISSEMKKAEKEKRRAERKERRKERKKKKELLKISAQTEEVCSSSKKARDSYVDVTAIEKMISNQRIRDNNDDKNEKILQNTSFLGSKMEIDLDVKIIFDESLQENEIKLDVEVDESNHKPSETSNAQYSIVETAVKDKEVCRADMEVVKEGHQNVKESEKIETAPKIIECNKELQEITLQKLLDEPSQSILSKMPRLLPLKQSPTVNLQSIGKSNPISHAKEDDSEPATGNVLAVPGTALAVSGKGSKEDVRESETFSPLPPMAKSNLDALISKTVDDIIDQLGVELMETGSEDQARSREEEDNFQSFLTNQIYNDFKTKEIQCLNELRLKASESREIFGSEDDCESKALSERSFLTETEQKFVAEINRSLGLDVSRKDESLEQIRQKFRWFQWNQFFVSNDENFAQDDEDPEKRSKNAKTVLEFLDEDNSRFINRINQRLAALQKPEEKKDQQTVHDLTQVHQTSRNEAEKTSDQSLSEERPKILDHSKIIDLTKGESSSESNKVKETKTLIKPGSEEGNKSTDFSISNILSTNTTVVESHSEVESEQSQDNSSKGFIWKKRLLIGYQQESHHEKPIDISSSISPVSSDMVSSEKQSQSQPPHQEQQQQQLQLQLKELSSQQNCSMETVRGSIAKISTIPLIRIASKGDELAKRIQNNLSQPEHSQLPIPAAIFMANPELQITPLSQSNNAKVCQRRPSCTLTKVIASKPVAKFCPKHNRFVKQGQQLPQLEKIQKAQQIQPFLHVQHNQQIQPVQQVQPTQLLQPVHPVPLIQQVQQAQHGEQLQQIQHFQQVQQFQQGRHGQEVQNIQHAQRVHQIQQNVQQVQHDQQIHQQAQQAELNRQVQQFSNSNHVIRLRNYRKLAFRQPTLQNSRLPPPPLVMPIARFPINMSIPSQLIPSYPIPRLERIPRPEEASRPLQPWVPPHQPVQQEGPHQHVRPLGTVNVTSSTTTSDPQDRREGSFYRSAKQFILADDTLSLVAR